MHTSPVLTAAVSRVAGALRAATQAWLTAATCYLLGLLVAGLRPTARRDDPSVAVPVTILVPAHDEESGVADTVAPLLDQDYAGEAHVVVIADNCSDDTATRAAGAGAEVWRRVDPESRGKGQAIRWALERVWVALPDTEIVVIVDADCVASPDLVSLAVAEIVDGGRDAAQAAYLVSNADASPIAALRAAGFTLRHAIRPRGRIRLGLSCVLFGSGMAFSRRLLTAIPWPGSGTEGTEMFVALIERGFSVGFVEHASVTSAMPVTAAEAESQQLRWETGNAQLAREHLRTLAWRAVRRWDREALGAAVELALPSQTTLIVGNLALASVSAARGDRVGLRVAVASLAGQAAFVTCGLLVADPSAGWAPALLHVPRFAVGRVRVLTRVAIGRGAGSWVRTTRTHADDAAAPAGVPSPAEGPRPQAGTSD